MQRVGVILFVYDVGKISVYRRRRFVPPVPHIYALFISECFEYPATDLSVLGDCPFEGFARRVFARYVRCRADVSVCAEVKPGGVLSYVRRPGVHGMSGRADFSVQDSRQSR